MLAIIFQVDSYLEEVHYLEDFRGCHCQMVLRATHLLPLLVSLLSNFLPTSERVIPDLHLPPHPCLELSMRAEKCAFLIKIYPPTKDSERPFVYSANTMSTYSVLGAALGAEVREVSESQPLPFRNSDM